MAKGVGRVTGCLPQELADQVVAQVLELFRPTGVDRPIGVGQANKFWAGQQVWRMGVGQTE